MATVVRPRGTSWGAVFGGWLAALGALAITLPIATVGASMAPAARARVDDPTLALPLVLALLVSWLVGGYVAGRMAGYRRSWHGLMSAIWGLFAALIVALAAGGSVGVASATASLPDLDLSSFGNATVFGFILGIVAVIFGGWLGGLLAPSPLVVAEVPRERERVVERRVPVVDRRDVAGEPTFWDRLTARDRAVETTRDEALVPPAQPTAPDGDGVARANETEVER